MNRTERGLKEAVNAAKLSTHSQFRLGAALYLGKRLISIGWNQDKTHPEQRSIFNWQHAELNCLIGTSKTDLSRATMYVARINKGGKLKIGKPCKDCQRILRASGLRRVIYTNRRGKPEELKL